MVRHATSATTEQVLRGRAILAGLVALAIGAGCQSSISVANAEAGGVLGQGTLSQRPNIVLLLTDDMRWDTLRYMPIVQRVLGRHGVTFTNAYVANPRCCPSRTSILTGLYSHLTGIYTNVGPDGGFPGFDDRSTIATWLHDAGYHTGLFGKYLNHYQTTYVPPGWDRWLATFGGSAYYDYVANVDGVRREFGSDASDYGTTVVRRAAVSFIRETDPETPFFLYWSPQAPHEPAIPAPSDRGDFRSLPDWRPKSHDEANVADKPAYVQSRPRISGSLAQEIDEFRRRQIESLQAVDRAVGAIVETLRETGRLENTIIVFTSDHGFLWGEHRWHGKSVPYEEAVAVPFVVRYDALLEESRTDDHLVVNIDLAPTFAELAGVAAPEVEGRSLVPLLEGSPVEWRDEFLIEHQIEHGKSAPSFCAVHTDRYVFVRYATREEELYDLNRDPLELVNRAGSDRSRSLRRDLLSSLHELCDPVPPGFTW
jgi:N-acetylglucosamine-6-sulfatase